MFDNMKSEVHVMKSLVEYQEGTIVSKTIISNGVCQYRKKKRGWDKIFSQKIMMDFVSSADRIITQGDSVVQTELCRLCNKIKRDKTMNKIQHNK